MLLLISGLWARLQGYRRDIDIETVSKRQLRRSLIKVMAARMKLRVLPIGQLYQFTFTNKIITLKS